MHNPYLDAKAPQSIRQQFLPELAQELDRRIKSGGPRCLGISLDTALAMKIIDALAMAENHRKSVEMQAARRL